MAGVNLLAPEPSDEQPASIGDTPREGKGRNLLAPEPSQEPVIEQPVAAPVPQPQGPNFSDKFEQYRTGQMSPEVSADFEELLKRKMPQMFHDKGFKEAEMPVPEMISQSVTNLPSSAKSVAGDFYQMVRHPIDTVEALGKTALGGVEKILPEEGFISTTGEHEEYFDSVVEGLSERYGSTERFKRAVAENPAEIVAAAFTEFLAPRGVQLARKTALKRAIDNTEITQFYDKTGKLLPEVEASISQSGIPREELMDILPENINMIEDGSKILSKAGKKTGVDKAVGEIAEEVMPSGEVIEAAKLLELDSQILPQYVSDNPTFIGVAKSLDKVPGSIMSNRTKSFIVDLSEKADDTLIKFGDIKDKTTISDNFRLKSRAIIDDLDDQAGKLYDEVGTNVPKNSPAITDNIIELLNKQADDLGGVDKLNPAQKKLLNELSGTTVVKEAASDLVGPSGKPIGKAVTEVEPPTYGLLELRRKEIGKALKGKESTFGSMEEGQLKQLYGALAEDQKDTLKGIDDDLLNKYTSANSLTAQRFGIQDQLVDALGKDLIGSITANAKTAIKTLPNDPKAFDKLLKSMPDEIGTTAKKEIIVSGIDDILYSGAKREFNPQNFSSFMEGLRKNKGSYTRLQKELGSETMERLEAISTLTDRINKVKGVSKVDIDKVPGMIGRVLQTVGRSATFKVLGRAGGTVSFGEARSIFDLIPFGKGYNKAAADALLTDPRFMQTLEKVAAGRLDTAKQVKEAEKLLTRSKKYKDWRNTLSSGAKSEIARLGIIGYLGKEATEDQTQEENTE
jgi:stalled ribosome alternative rescue factor ArfA